MTPGESKGLKPRKTPFVPSCEPPRVTGVVQGRPRGREHSGVTLRGESISPLRQPQAETRTITVTTTPIPTLLPVATTRPMSAPQATWPANG